MGLGRILRLPNLGWKEGWGLIELIIIIIKIEAELFV